MDQEEEEREGLLGRDSQRAATHASHSASPGRSCSSYDGLSAVGKDSLEPVRQSQAQGPPALPFAYLRRDSKHRERPTKESRE